MSGSDLPMHYVCTHQEAEEIIKNQTRFFVSNCGCREGRGKCDQSRMDVCVSFTGAFATGSGQKEVDRAFVAGILAEAKAKDLVARPFRDESRKNDEGLCFCCNDCCSYFADRSEICDRGKFVEKTDMETCTDCEACVDFCYFGARKMEDGKLKVTTSECYGCGLCLTACPEDCIEMVPRN
jgi:ferredoxin